jgi:hypothetical protein
LINIISTDEDEDEDPGLRIESFAVINLRGVSTNKTIICFIAMQTYKELKNISVLFCSKHRVIFFGIAIDLIRPGRYQCK